VVSACKFIFLQQGRECWLDEFSLKKA